MFASWPDRFSPPSSWCFPFVVAGLWLWPLAEVSLNAGREYGGKELFRRVQKLPAFFARLGLKLNAILDPPGDAGREFSNWGEFWCDGWLVVSFWGDGLDLKERKLRKPPGRLAD